MAAPIVKIGKGLSSILQIGKLNGFLNSTSVINQISARHGHGWVNWMMLRDVKRRKLVEEYSPMRMRLNAIRKNNVLPKEIREIADKEVDAFPLNSNLHHCRNRCVLTSRPRGNQRKWRMSRIVWRNLADYNKLPGVTRAWW